VNANELSTCKQCGRAFKVQAGLMRHIGMMHSRPNCEHEWDGTLHYENSLLGQPMKRAWLNCKHCPATKPVSTWTIQEEP
jgi:hypothetical protein